MFHYLILNCFLSYLSSHRDAIKVASIALRWEFFISHSFFSHILIFQLYFVVKHGGVFLVY